MRITMLGAGYVGLTTGAALAYLGHDVCCLDKDEGKIDRLKQGQPPLYEPHLQELLELSGAHLRFTTDYAAAIPEPMAAPTCVSCARRPRKWARIWARTTPSW